MGREARIWDSRLEHELRRGWTEKEEEEKEEKFLQCESIGHRPKNETKNDRGRERDKVLGRQRNTRKQIHRQDGEKGKHADWPFNRLKNEKTSKGKRQSIFFNAQ